MKTEWLTTKAKDWFQGLETHAATFWKKSSVVSVKIGKVVKSFTQRTIKSVGKMKKKLIYGLVAGVIILSMIALSSSMEKEDSLATAGLIVGIPILLLFAAHYLNKRKGGNSAGRIGWSPNWGRIKWSWVLWSLVVGGIFTLYYLASGPSTDKQELEQIVNEQLEEEARTLREMKGPVPDSLLDTLFATNQDPEDPVRRAAVSKKTEKLIQSGVPAIKVKRRMEEILNSTSSRKQEVGFSETFWLGRSWFISSETEGGGMFPRYATTYVDLEKPEYPIRGFDVRWTHNGGKYHKSYRIDSLSTNFMSGTFHQNYNGDEYRGRFVLKRTREYGWVGGCFTDIEPHRRWRLHVEGRKAF